MKIKQFPSTRPRIMYFNCFHNKPKQAIKLLKEVQDPLKRK